MVSDSGLRTDQFLSSTDIFSLGVDTRLPNIVFAGLSGSIFKSIDRGQSWNLVFPTSRTTGRGVNDIQFSPTNPIEMWAGGEAASQQPYLIHSTDGGFNWEIVLFHFNGNFFGDNVVHDIAIDARNDSVLYFGMRFMIVKTTNKGETFENTLGWESYEYEHWHLAMNPNNPDEIFATGFYLYRTLDGGKSWLRIKPPKLETCALAVDWYNRVLFISVIITEKGIYKLQF